jgi:hypothetical protein
MLRMKKIRLNSGGYGSLTMIILQLSSVQKICREKRGGGGGEDTVVLVRNFPLYSPIRLKRFGFEALVNYPAPGWW